MMILVLSGVGTLTLTILTLRVALFIRRFQKPSALSRYIKDNEAWALVTGGSDGESICGSRVDTFRVLSTDCNAQVSD